MKRKKDEDDDGYLYPSINMKFLFVIIILISIVFTGIIVGAVNLFDELDNNSMNTSNNESNVSIIIIPAENNTLLAPLPIGFNNNLSISVIDIGQGDAILLTKGNVSLMVDAGQSMRGTDCKNKLVSSISDPEIEYLLTTHQDYDHIGNAQFIITNYKVGTFIDNGYIHTSKTYKELLNYVTSSKMQYRIVKTGDKINVWDDVIVTVVSPVKLTKDINENSIVLLVTYGDVKMLLTGDAGNAVEPAVAKLVGDIDVLKVGHHGSNSATSDEFLSVILPEVSIISVGADNSYGHPTQSVLNALNVINSTVYRTDKCGTVTVDTDGKYYTILTEF